MCIFRVKKVNISKEEKVGYTKLLKSLSINLQKAFLNFDLGTPVEKVFSNQIKLFDLTLQKQNSNHSKRKQMAPKLSIVMWTFR